MRAAEKMADVLCVYRKVKLLKKDACGSAEWHVVFSSPWSVSEIEQAFVVSDANG